MQVESTYLKNLIEKYKPLEQDLFIEKAYELLKYLDNEEALKNFIDIFSNDKIIDILKKYDGHERINLTLYNIHYTLSEITEYFQKRDKESEELVLNTFGREDVIETLNYVEGNLFYLISYAFLISKAYNNWNILKNMIKSLKEDKEDLLYILNQFPKDKKAEVEILKRYMCSIFFGTNRKGYLEALKNEKIKELYHKHGKIIFLWAYFSKQKPENFEKFVEIAEKIESKNQRS